MPSFPNSADNLTPQSELREGQDVSRQISETQSNEQLVELIKNSIRTAQQDKEKFGYSAQMEKFDRLYRNKLYQNNSQKRLYFESRANYYRQYVDGMATLLNRDPVIDAVLRRDKAHADLKAEVLERIIDYVNYKNDRTEKDFDLAVTAGKYGDSFYKIEYDPNEDDFQGLPILDVIDPKYCFITPGATSIEKASWFGYKRPVATYQLQQLYPDLEIRSDSDVTTSIPNNTKEGGKFTFSDSDPNNNAFLTWSANGTKLNIGKGAGRQTWLIDFYYRDPAKIDLITQDDLIQWMDENPGFGNKIKRMGIFKRLLSKLPMTTLKYPFGRKIQLANEHILEDNPNPYPWIPFIHFGMYRDPSNFWSEGIISLAREMVKNIHIASSGMAANVDFRTRPAFQTASKKWDDNQSFTLNPNDLKILENPQAEIKPIQVPEVAPADIIRLIEFRIKEIESVTGVNAALLGKMPDQGSPSSIQMQEIQDAAAGLLLQIFRRYLKCRREVGNRFLWMIQNYMTDKREILFVSPDDQTQQSQGQPQPQAGQPQAPQTVMSINQGASMGQPMQNDVTEGDWEYYIDEAFGRPFGYAARFKQIDAAAAALDKFAPDQAASLRLEASQMPGYRKYQQVVAQRFQFQMEMSISEKTRERELKEMEVVNKIESEKRKAEAQEVKSASYALGLEGRAVKDTADALATGFGQQAEELVKETTTPLPPTPQITPPPEPMQIPGVGPLPGSFAPPQSTPIEPGGKG